VPNVFTAPPQVPRRCSGKEEGRMVMVGDFFTGPDFHQDDSVGLLPLHPLQVHHRKHVVYIGPNVLHRQPNLVGHLTERLDRVLV
jgi:hypothetical protein